MPPTDSRDPNAENASKTDFRLEACRQWRGANQSAATESQSCYRECTHVSIKISGADVLRDLLNCRQPWLILLPMRGCVFTMLAPAALVGHSCPSLRPAACRMRRHALSCAFFTPVSAL